MSSGFKENFERGEKESLDYDDSAFYYFSVALLLIGLIPATWYFIMKPVMYGEIAINYSLKSCKCKICEDRLAKRSAVYRFSWLNVSFLFKFFIIVIGWFMCYVCFDAVKDIEPLRDFVPNEILGVATDATIG